MWDVDNYVWICLIEQSAQARVIMPNPHGDPLLKQPLMKLQPQAYDILFGKPGYVCLFVIYRLVDFADFLFSSVCWLC